MSLVSWLPLNGDLNDHGIGCFTWTNADPSTLTTSTAGKIGSCYQRNTILTAGRIYTNQTVNLNGDISMCCWAKVIETVGDTANGLVSAHSHADNTGVAICVKQVSSSDYRISCSTGTGSSRTFYSYYGTTNIKNEWHHLALTYNKIAQKLLLYVDGNIEYTLNNYSNASKEDKIMLFEWSTTHNNGAYRPATMLNDVRIYDNCLSATEIKEIAKGLVLHYPLKDEYIEHTTNLVTSITPGGQTSVNNGVVTTSGVNADTYFTLIMSESLVNGTRYTISCFAENIPNGTEFVFPIGGQSNTALKFHINKNGLNSYTFTMNDFNAGTNRCFMDDTLRTAYTARCEFSNWQIEKKDHVTPYTSTSRSETTVWDCSGYSYNGTASNGLAISNDSARYLASTNFVDSQQSIMIGNLSTIVPSGIFTFNIWFKKKTGEWSTKGYETIIGGPSGFELEAKSASSNTAVIRPYSWGGSGGERDFNYTLDQWNMLTMVRTTSDTKFYLNGQLVQTGTAGGLPSGNYFLGAWRDTISQNYRGYMSDARIYSTALSADDILDLYNAPIKVTKNGTLITNGEVIEV